MQQPPPPDNADKPGNAVDIDADAWNENWIRALAERKAKQRSKNAAKQPPQPHKDTSNGR